MRPESRLQSGAPEVASPSGKSWVDATAPARAPFRRTAWPLSADRLNEESLTLAEGGALLLIDQKWGNPPGRTFPVPSAVPLMGPTLCSAPGNKMPLFDTYVMVDWSGGDGRRAGKSDCLWIAHGPKNAAAPTTVSPRSRTEAEGIIRSLLETVVEAGGRALVCADFAYGYPAGFASLLRSTAANSQPPWRVVWQYLSQHLQDDLGTKPGRVPTNRTNRFALANAVNTAASASSPGPFWCLFKAGSFACVPQRQPPQPFALAGGRTIAPLRVTDVRAKSDTPFRLFGTGSVGSQIITGIPRLQGIRFAPTFADDSAVWPFETGWAPTPETWPAIAGLRVLHAEIYPSVRPALPDAIKDRGQVRAMWHWARERDAKDLLVSEFSLPPGITGGTRDEVTIRTEEGWILGCPG